MCKRTLIIFEAVCKCDLFPIICNSLVELVNHLADKKSRIQHSRMVGKYEFLFVPFMDKSS